MALNVYNSEWISRKAKPGDEFVRRSIYDVAVDVRDAKIAALEAEYEKLKEWALYAEEIINDGVAIMTLEEMSSWGGVRHCLETNPADKET